jgi:hypothetical protein
MTVSTEVEAAVAYDAESVQRRGLEAITNFALDEYTDLLSERPFAVLEVLLEFDKEYLQGVFVQRRSCEYECSGWSHHLAAGFCRRRADCRGLATWPTDSRPW